MPDIQHNVLTTTDLHEPKGASTATSGQVYVADGAGSGTWKNLTAYATINNLESDAVSISTIGTTAQTMAFTNNGLASNATADAANNRITSGETGVYFVTFCCSFSTTASGDAGSYEFKIMDNGVATGFACSAEMSGTNDRLTVSCQGIVDITTGHHITVEVESDNGSNTDDIDIYFSNIAIQRLG